MFNFWKKLTYENIKNSYEKGKVEKQKDIEYFVKVNLKLILKKIKRNADNGIGEASYFTETRLGFDDKSEKEVRDRVTHELKKIGFEAKESLEDHDIINVKID